MTSNKQDGGPAYPLQPASMPEMHYLGMSLRDYFAGQALVGLLGGRGGPIQKIFLSDEASLCYQYADAMLTERNKQ